MFLSLADFCWTWSVPHIFAQTWLCLFKSWIKSHCCCVTTSSKLEEDSGSPESYRTEQCGPYFLPTLLQGYRNSEQVGGREVSCRLAYLSVAFQSLTQAGWAFQWHRCFVSLSSYHFSSIPLKLSPMTPWFTKPNSNDIISLVCCQCLI